MLDLNELYRKINRKAYSGQLPKDTRVVWSDRIEKGSVAASHVHGLTPCNHRYSPPKRCKSSYIRVHPDFKRWDVVAELAVWHEMIHISALLGDKRLLNHGPAFHDKMDHFSAYGLLRGLL